MDPRAAEDYGTIEAAAFVAESRTARPGTWPNGIYVRDATGKKQNGMVLLGTTPQRKLTENSSKNMGKVENATCELEFLLKGPEFLSSGAGPEGIPKPRIAAASISFLLNSLYRRTSASGVMERGTGRSGVSRAGVETVRRMTFCPVMTVELGVTGPISASVRSDLVRRSRRGYGVGRKAHPWGSVVRGTCSRKA